MFRKIAHILEDRPVLWVDTVKPSRWPLALLLLTVIVVFGQVAGFDFVWDDHSLVVENRLTATFQNGLNAFAMDLWATSGNPDPTSGYYRPLFVVDLGITRLLAGLAPGAHHLHGLLWHLLAIVVGAKLLYTIRANTWSVGVGLALFALHPVQVEAVGFVSARNDLMATTFLLGALLLLSRERPQKPALLGGAALVLAAMLSKESVALAPLLLAAICQARHGRWGAKSAHGAAMVGVVAAVIMRLMAGVEWPEQADISHLLGAAGPTFIHILARLVWPVDLAPLVHLGWPPPLPWLTAGAGGLALMVVGVLGGRAAWAGLAFAAMAVAPVLAGVAHTGAIVDRYLYLPMFGVSIGVGFVAQRVRWPRAMFGLTTVVLGMLTAGQLQLWRNDATLWTTAMARAPSGYAAGALARWLEDTGQPDRAAGWYLKAIQAEPRPFKAACYNITRVHLRLGDPPAAVRTGQLALEAGCAPSPELLAPLALALALTGDWGEAERVANQVDQDPTGKAIIVRLGAQARVGNLEPLRVAIEEAGGEPVTDLIRQVVWLVEQSGEPQAAAAIRGDLNRLP